MRKSDKEETPGKSRQTNEAASAPSAAKSTRLTLDPVCRPIGVIFGPSVPDSGGLVTGVVAIKGVATSDCPVNVTSLNANVFTPQHLTTVRKGSTVAAVSGIYTPLPSNSPSVVYVYASNDSGATPPTAIVLKTIAATGNAAATHQVVSLTYPKFTTSGIVTGTVTITPAAGHGGVDVYVSSDSPYFQPVSSPVHVLPGQTTAPVPTNAFVQTGTTVTANMYAQCEDSAIGPIPIPVPNP